MRNKNYLGNHKIGRVKKTQNTSFYAEFENSVSRRGKTRQVIRGTFEEILRLISIDYNIIENDIENTIDKYLVNRVFILNNKKEPL